VGGHFHCVHGFHVDIERQFLSVTGRKINHFVIPPRSTNNRVFYARFKVFVIRMVFILTVPGTGSIPNRVPAPRSQATEHVYILRAVTVHNGSFEKKKKKNNVLRYVHASIFCVSRNTVRTSININSDSCADECLATGQATWTFSKSERTKVVRKVLLPFRLCKTHVNCCSSRGISFIS
jgi:hypothetical protein